MTTTPKIPVKPKEIRIRFTCIYCDMDVWAGEFEGYESGVIICPCCHAPYQWVVRVDTKE